MKQVDLIVEKVGDLSKSTKYNYLYNLVILKGVEDGKTYKLNLNKKPDRSGEINYVNWFNNLKPGAVLRCVLQERYPMNVDQWKSFQVIKKAEEAPKPASNIVATDKKQAAQLALSLELDKIQTSINNIRNDFGL